MSGSLKLNTPSAGSVTLSPADTASNVTVTIPASTATLVNASSTQTLTNKTLTSPALTTPTITGNLTFSTSNAGVVFNNSSALVNSTFNDYEIGTWTPVLNAMGGTTGWTPSGTYTKIGRFVYVSVTISPGSGTITSTANTSYISGLPFSVSGTSALGYAATNYIEGLGAALPYGLTGIYTPTWSVTTSRTIFVTGAYQASF